MQVDQERRCLLKQSLALAASALTACGGGSYGAAPIGDATQAPVEPVSPTSPPPVAPPAADTWVPVVPTMIVGSGAIFDLSTTLPTGVARGGTFGMDSSGAPLPVGMSLRSDGKLLVGTAVVGAVSGVLFTYEEP